MHSRDNPGLHLLCNVTYICFPYKAVLEPKLEPVIFARRKTKRLF